MIKNIFEEQVQWTVLNIEDGIARIKLLGEESFLHGAEFDAPILTTDTLIQTSVYAIQTYASISFTILAKKIGIASIANELHKSKVTNNQ